MATLRGPGSCLSYLPGDLASYLDPQRDSLRCFEALYDLVRSGYYRGAHRLLQVGQFERKSSTDLELLAEILCSMSPLNHRIAYHCAFHIWEYRDDADEILSYCLKKRCLEACRFAMGNFRGSISMRLSFGFHSETFTPGFVEALLKEPAIIASCRLVEFVMPRTYEAMLKSELIFPVDEESRALGALIVGNYRLANHIRSRCSKDLSRRLVNEMKARGNRISIRLLVVLASQGWITPEEEREVRQCLAPC